MPDSNPEPQQGQPQNNHNSQNKYCCVYFFHVLLLSAALDTGDATGLRILRLTKGHLHKILLNAFQEYKCWTAAFTLSLAFALKLVLLISFCEERSFFSLQCKTQAVDLKVFVILYEVTTLLSRTVRKKLNFFLRNCNRQMRNYNKFLIHYALDYTLYGLHQPKISHNHTLLEEPKILNRPLSWLPFLY